ncbi:hypothetical protein GCM10023195_55660 [Actinoallomurus liliacearum]|uniref:Uncharacterized protein n=1 Tax=Actinoallomurus liliacearum TaxID=1080073 RepID=A0ABP8TSC1_9ACTN
MDEHCRITVVGERLQVDLAVPADAPITSYVNTLAELCAQPEADVMPAAWSLALPTGEPYSPERSLNQLGIVDGHLVHGAGLGGDSVQQGDPDAVLMRRGRQHHHRDDQAQQVHGQALTPGHFLAHVPARRVRGHPGRRVHALGVQDYQARIG